MSFSSQKTEFPGVFILDNDIFQDNRGSFTRLFCRNELSEIIGSRQIVQVNRSITPEKGNVRGMHFQLPPHAEMKLVRCTQGKIFDVIVDLRAGSPTFLKWLGTDLSKENDRLLVVPEGFAHGFQVLEPNSELMYLVTSFYNPSAERGIRFDDPRINICWPLPPTGLSGKDMTHPYIDPDYSGMVL